MRPTRAIGALLAVAAVAAWPAGAPALRSAKPGGRAFTAQLTSQTTNQGQTQGDTTTGIVVKGSFSAKLSPGAALLARIIGAATGVPYADIAKGGSYAARYSVAGSGGMTGLFVTKFKAHGLGSACASYTVKFGAYTPGSSFVPANVSFKVVGGTGRAAHLRGSGKVTQTGISGTSIEDFSSKGSASLSMSKKAKKPSAACKAVR